MPAVPANLAHTLQVQFVGGDRSCLRSHADLQVSVEKLRSAIVWLSTNSWPFMEATKHHDAWESGCLEGNLEELLQQYAVSTGSQNGGVPAEIVQGASAIALELSKVALRGLADCVAADGDEGDEAAKAALSFGPKLNKAKAMVKPNMNATKANSK